MSDLFTVFPDLPWPRIGHPPRRRWSELPPPPPSDLPRSHERRRFHESESGDDTLRRIYAIALTERRLTGNKRGRRAINHIIDIARSALQRP